jgi:hypothetical protein
MGRFTFRERVGIVVYLVLYELCPFLGTICDKLVGCCVRIVEWFEKRGAYIKDWNGWRKGNRNSSWHKFLVLIGAVHSPTFEYYRSFGAHF